MKKDIDIESLVNDYENFIGVETIAQKYHIGKKKVKEILKNENIEIRGKGCKRILRNFVVEDWKIQKYPPIEGFHYVAKSKDGEIESNDIDNRGGVLTTYIEKKYGIPTPTLYDRRIYYQTTGDYWWEQWFDIVKVENERTKKCPYCDWETVDLENKSGAFLVHLSNYHNKTVEEYLKEHPDDELYFSKYQKEKQHKEVLKDRNNYVVCPICGERFEKITPTHIKYHNITYEEFKKTYPYAEVISNNMINQTHTAQTLSNLVISKNRFVSKYERELQDFLNKNNINFSPNRQILIGKEIDLLIEDKKIGIEFDGLKWHTEWFGRKSHTYHLEKTIECNKKGYDLIHIFEDEYINHKDIVYSKLSHILNLDSELPKIMGRKCVVKEILMDKAKNFLDKYHIQGYAKSSIYLGAFFEEKMVAVMSFKNGSMRNHCWELTRFATDYHYRFQGVGGKMFSYFIKQYEPNEIISFADRRWTLNENNNLYIKLGFSLEKVCPPDYKYYNDKSETKFERIHKMRLNKKTLSRKYGFPLTMTETEMAKELGYDRIWDCGLFKYVWKNNNYTEGEIKPHIFSPSSNIVVKSREERMREAFIEKAKAVHSGENLNYSKVEYINNRTPVLIIDHDLKPDGTEYGEFWQAPTNHLKGQGHPDKRGLKIRLAKRSKEDEIIKRFKEVHAGENLDYSEVEYVNMHTKVKIISHDLRPDGTEYGEFWQEPSVHLKGCTHPDIGREKQNSAIRYTTEKFIEIASEIHKDENYSYELVDYKGSQEKVCIVCNKIGSNGLPHGKFYISPDSFIQGKGCPICGNHLSKAENEIYSFICGLIGENEVIRRDTTILGGKELDIYIPKHKLAFEFNGLKWHSEQYQRNHSYHLDKTISCNEKGVTLIHIFEDEYIDHKDLVLNKIGHMLGCGEYVRIGARKCEIREVKNRDEEAKEFLNKNHIQGYYGYRVAYGAYYEGKLIGLMCFILENDGTWNLTRFATDINYICPGIASRLFSKFVDKYKPTRIKSFLDRRWANGNKPNIYEILGFELEEVLEPDYRYTDGHGKRMHKFGFRKQILNKKYGLPLTMTENEMTKELGYYKVWDCGLFKYVWAKK